MSTDLLTEFGGEDEDAALFCMTSLLPSLNINNKWDCEHGSSQPIVSAFTLNSMECTVDKKKSNLSRCRLQICLV